MKKTLLVGSFGAGNIGDELILRSALTRYNEVVVMTNDEYFSQKFSGQSFTTMPFPPTGLKSFFRFVFSRKYRQALLRFQSDIKEVVFPGGGLFAIKFRAYFLWWLVFRWFKFIFDKSVVFRFEYQGIDFPRNFLARKMLENVFHQVDYVSVRDAASKQALQLVLNKEAGGKVDVFGDSVYESLINYGFSAEKYSFTDGNVENVGVDVLVGNGDLLLVNTRSFVDQENCSFEELEKLANINKLELVIVLFDALDRKFVPDDFTGSVIFPRNFESLVYLFLKSKICIGERFHFILLADIFCKQGFVKLVFLLKKPYSEKVSNFANLNNIAVFDLESCNLPND